MKSMFLCMLMPIWCLQAKARSGCTRFPSRRTPWLKQELIKISGRRAWHSKTFASESVRKFGAMIYIYIYCLVVSSMNFIFHFISGMSSFPLTNSYFSRWLKPPTTYIYINITILIIICFQDIYIYIWYIHIYIYNPPTITCTKPGARVPKLGSHGGGICGVVESDSSAFDVKNMVMLLITIWILPNVSKCHICQNLPYKSIS